MAKRCMVVPSGHRAKQDYRRLEEIFSETAGKLVGLGEVNLGQIGIDWNQAVLRPYKNGRMISYDVGDMHNVTDRKVSGLIKDIGRHDVGIEVVNGRQLIGSADFTHDYVTETLSEAAEIAKKLEIMANTVILPAGEVEHNGNGNGKSNGVDYGDTDEYRLFASELLEKANRIAHLCKDVD